MEFTEEFIQENGLTDEQINAISPVVDKHVTTELGAKVHEHTENNLSKIWGTVKDLTGIERENGEKYADAIKRATELHFKGSEESYNRKLSELDEKIKNTKGDDSLKSELEAAKEQLTELKSIAEEHEDWKKNDYKNKYEETLSKLSNTQRKVAFNSVRPQKPEGVNEYEWKAKWDNWEKGILETHNIVFKEEQNEWIAVSKEQDWVKEKLSDLAKQDNTLQELVKGRQQTGTGVKTGEKVVIEGVPFEVPKDATAKERQTAVKEYLAGQGIKTTDSDYAKKFAELNTKILGLGKKQAD